MKHLIFCAFYICCLLVINDKAMGMEYSLSLKWSRKLFNAIANGNFEDAKKAIHALTSHGMSINISDKEGWQPLHRAVLAGHASIVRLILENGGDKKALSPNGLLSCQLASSPAVIRLLATIFERDLQDAPSRHTMSNTSDDQDCQDWDKMYLSILEENKRWSDTTKKNSCYWRNLKNYGVSMESSNVYVPKQVEHEDEWVAWINIHGTWGSTEEFPLLQSCAASFAQAKRRKLIFLTYRWSGKNRGEDRIDAGQGLYKILQNMGHLTAQTDIVIVAHSHGCSVANHFSQLIDSDNPIYMLIYFACPPRQDLFYEARHFGSLIYFWSSGDLVVPFGRIDGRKAKSLMQGIARGVQHMCQCPAYEDDEMPPLFDRPDEHIIVGIHVEINSKTPGHSEIKKVFPFLRRIITQLHLVYPAHYSSSALFAVNINEHHDSIFLTVRDPNETYERAMRVFSTLARIEFDSCESEQPAFINKIL